MIRTPLLRFCILIALQISATAEDRDVLFVGNSYTQGIRATITELYAQSDQKSTKLGFVHPGGKTLAHHQTNGKTEELINSGDFEVVVLQEQSQTPAAMPDQFLKASAELEKQVKASNAVVVFYQTWGRRDGDPRNGLKDYIAMQEALTKAYITAGKSLDAKVAPVGEAWKLVHDKKPELFAKLYQKDGSHPSAFGAYLAAITIFATINDLDPTTIKWNGKTPPAEALFLRQAAAAALREQRQ